MIIWLTIIAAGLLTYATRLSSILLYGKFEMPILVERALRFVPVAVLTAIFFPELLIIQGDLMLSFRNPRLLAGLLAILVAWRTKNVMYTIVIGMLTLWLLQFIFN
ncbi:MAG TPA: AzlD domain-containing protein [Anaerolineales bacterium]|jgi:branched-subunit amino acid transport protein|nr:AzlD domain-containing protein [Anaerolineales bacterium]HUV27986.1 AzlD domain-containing protein [Anaerolineales bacterium]